MRRRLIFAFWGACLAVSPASAQTGQADKLWALYTQRDFFALETQLPPPTDTESPTVAFVRAATDAAFNHLERSSAALEALLRRPLSDDALVQRARKLLLLNRRAQGLYAASIAAANLPPDASRDSPAVADLRNSASLLMPIVASPPPAVVRKGPPSAVTLDKDGTFPVEINGHPVRMGLDTGANFSFIPHSVAVAAGLQLRQSSAKIGTSTGSGLNAEVAVADIAIGSAMVRHAVFLVFPDAALTMPDGFVISGMVGFPVFSVLGGLRQDKDAIVFGAAETPAPTNLALAGNDILTRISFRGADLICRVDSGADSTTFYAPFYRRFSKLFAGPVGKARFGGVGGAKTVPAKHPDKIEFVVAGQTVQALKPDVLTQSIFAPEDDYLNCNIGRDVLGQHGAYQIDIADLSLILGSERQTRATP